MNQVTNILIKGGIPSATTLVKGDFISFSVSSLITPLTVRTSGTFIF